MTSSFILIGAAGAGKKHLLNRLHGNAFTTSTLRLFGLDKAMMIRVNNNNKVHTLQLEAHSLGGNFDSISDKQRKFQGNKKALICIDVHSSFDEAMDTINQSLTLLDRSRNSGGAPLLVITKYDSTDRKLTASDIERLRLAYELDIIQTDALREDAASGFFHDLFEKINKISSKQIDDGITSAKSQFIDEHQRLYNLAKSVFLIGIFRRRRVNYSDSLEDILHHAKLSNNRSRQAFINLGWMRRNGSIIEDAAPEELKIADQALTSSIII